MELSVATVRGNSPNFRVELNSVSTLSMESELRLNNQSYINLPVGTTAARPANGVQGSIRFNEDLSRIEVFTGSLWKPL